MNQLVNAGEDEDGFDQLNDETFGELSNSHDDWEFEHEKLTECPPDQESANDDVEEPLCLLKYPLSSTDIHSLKPPACFQAPLTRHANNNHLLEDEAELDIHESDLARQLSRLVMENEEEEERFNNARQHNLRKNDLWHVPGHDLQTPDTFRLFSSPANNKITLHHPLQQPFNPSFCNTSTTPLLASGKAIKSKMTLKELESLLINYDEKKEPREQATPQSTSTHWQQPPQSLSLPPLPQAPFSQEQQMKDYMIQQQQHQQQLQIQDYFHSQRLALQHQQQQLLLQLQQTQIHAGQIQQRLVVGNHPHLNSSQLQQQIMLRQQQQQLFKLQHFLQHSLQQIHHHSLLLHQQYEHFSRHQNVSKLDNKHQMTHFPQYQQQNFQEQQMMMMAPVVQHRAPDDPYYDGLMEQREKDWLVRIQLMQLHTDNPLIDDYYYTCWSMKKLIKENKRLKKDVDKNRKEEEKRMNDEDDKKDGDEDDYHSGSDDEDGGKVAKLLISTDGQTDSKEYIPVQYEGSLGKLRASSIYNPRRVLDVQGSRSVDEGKKHDDKKLKEILCKIEKGFDLLLQADELHNKICKVDMDMRDNLEIKRFDLIERLSNDLLGNGCQVLQQVVHIRKGVVMLTRWMPLLSKEEEQHEVVSKLMLKLHTLVKKEWCHEIAHKLYKTLSAFISKTTSLSRMVEYCNNLQKSCKLNSIDKYMASLLGNQLSCSCIHLMIVSFEGLLAQSTAPEPLQVLPSSQLQKWSDFISVVGRCMGKTTVDSRLFRSHKVQAEAAFRKHLERFLEESIVKCACHNLYSPPDTNKSF